jgi:hypothetical protein
MAVYMDRHYIEGATQHAVADAHQKIWRFKINTRSSF